MKHLIDSLLEGFATSNDKIGFRKTLIEILENISEGKIAYSAFRHKLEFICLEINDLRSNKAVIRFHIWDKEILANQEYHNHRYNFSSYVLFGTLLNEIANVVEHPTGEFAHVVVEYSGAISKRVPSQKRFAIKEINSLVIKEGDFYRLKCDDFHRSLCISIPTITVFAMDLSEQKDTADVILKEAIDIEVSVKTPIDDRNLRALLKSILTNNA